MPPSRENREDFFIPMPNESLTNKEHLGIKIDSTDQFIKLSAWPIGSLIVSLGSPSLLLLITLLFYVASTILMFLLHIQERTTEKVAQGKGVTKFLLSISQGVSLASSYGGAQTEGVFALLPFPVG